MFDERGGVYEPRDEVGSGVALSRATRPHTVSRTLSKFPGVQLTDLLTSPQVPQGATQPFLCPNEAERR